MTATEFRAFSLFIQLHEVVPQEVMPEGYLQCQTQKRRRASDQTAVFDVLEVRAGWYIKVLYLVPQCHDRQKQGREREGCFNFLRLNNFPTIVISYRHTYADKKNQKRFKYVNSLSPVLLLKVSLNLSDMKL